MWYSPLNVTRLFLKDIPADSQLYLLFKKKVIIFFKKDNYLSCCICLLECLLPCFSLARYLIWPLGLTFAYSLCSLSRSGIGSSSSLLVFVNKNLLENNCLVPLNIVFGVLCPTVAVWSNCSCDHMTHNSKIFTLWSCIRNSLLTIGIGLFAFQFYFIIYLAELGLCGCT